jgi:hypothetical protein
MSEKHSGCLLLELPLGIITLIYEELVNAMLPLENQAIITDMPSTSTTDKTRAFKARALAQTNRQIRTESLEILYRDLEVVIILVNNGLCYALDCVERFVDSPVLEYTSKFLTTAV